MNAAQFFYTQHNLKGIRRVVFATFCHQKVGKRKRFLANCRVIWCFVSFVAFVQHAGNSFMYLFVQKGTQKPPHVVFRGRAPATSLNGRSKIVPLLPPVPGARMPGPSSFRSKRKCGALVAACRGKEFLLLHFACCISGFPDLMPEPLCGVWRKSASGGAGVLAPDGEGEVQSPKPEARSSKPQAPSPKPEAVSGVRTKNPGAIKNRKFRIPEFDFLLSLEQTYKYIRDVFS